MLLQTAFSSIRRFQQAYLWMARDHLKAHKAEVAWIVVLNAIGAVAQGGIIAFIALAVDLLASGGTFGVPFLDSLLDTTLAKLVGFGIALLIIVLIGAWATYVTLVRTRQLARLFHERCMVRAVGAFERGSTLSHPGMPPARSEVKRAVVRDSNQLGNALETMVRMVEPCFRLIVAIILLVVISRTITLYLLPLLAILLPVIYKLNTHIQSISKRYFEHSVVGLHQRVGKILRRVNVQNVLRSSRPAVDPRDDEIVRSYLDQYDRLVLSQVRVQFVIALASALLPVLALLIGGYLASQGELSWGLLLAYLIALRQLVIAIRAFQGFLTTLSLFYPAIKRHRRLCEEAPLEDHDSDNEVPEHITVTSAHDLPDGEDQVILQPGQPTIYVLEESVERINLADVVAPLAQDKETPRTFWRRNTCFIDARAKVIDASLVEVLGQDPDGSRRERSADWLEAMGVADQFDQAIGALDTPITAALWDDIDDALRLAILTCPLASDTRRLILLDARWLRRVDKATAVKLLEKLADRFVLLVTTGMSIPARFSKKVIVVRQGRVAGLGDTEWFERVRSQLEARSTDDDTDEKDVDDDDE